MVQFMVTSDHAQCHVIPLSRKTEGPMQRRRGADGRIVTFNFWMAKQSLFALVSVILCLRYRWVTPECVTHESREATQGKK